MDARDWLVGRRIGRLLSVLTLLAMGAAVWSGCASTATATGEDESAVARQTDVSRGGFLRGQRHVVQRPIAPAVAEEPAAPMAKPVAMKPPSAGTLSLAYPTGHVGSSALLLEKIVPDQVQAGAPFEHQLKVTNLMDAALDSVTVMDAIPPTMRLTSSMPSASSVEGGVARRDLGRLDPKQVSIIRVMGTAPAAGVIRQCATASYE